MDSTKEIKVMGAEKEMAQSRRSFLRLGALGAAAVIAAGVLPTGQAKAATPSAKAVRTGGEVGTATGGKQTRSARKMRSMGEMGERAEGGASTRSNRSMKTQRSTKSEKSTGGNRSASTRKMGERSAQRSMKAMKETKS
jgi:hypothetical protein